ncbi:P-loop containing nucleoside triphosphate hydrolase protein [Flammula alnicola]|nr:P-loop containing nucleoside triphosphate hydrolase protein [Flammula alnicola]
MGVFEVGKSEYPLRIAKFPRSTPGKCVRNDRTESCGNKASSYFDQFKNKKSEEEKITFSVARKNATQVPGRTIWRDFITEGWKNWQMHAKITKVLSTERLHPLTLALSARNGSVENWPQVADYLPSALDPIGIALFGDEALDVNGRLEMQLRRTTRALIYRTWNNIRNQVGRSKNHIVNLEKKATDAFDGLDRDKPTKANIKTVIVKLSRWKALAESLQLPEVMERVEAMEAELQALMLGISPQLKVSNTKPKTVTSKVNAAALKQLASDDDVEDVVNLYLDFFDTPAAADSVPLQEQHPTTSVKFGDSENGVDLGVEVESSMTPEALSNALGFPASRLPLLFNSFRHKAGLSSWDPENAHLFKPDAAAKNPEMDPISLHWHQLAGIHAVMRMNFTEKPDSRPCGALIADEVGLGKTFQAAAIIACLSDLAMRQKLQKPLPPVVSRTPYLGQYDSLPRLPHLIVVPGTLLSQWESELKTIFRRGAFDILIYGTGKAVREQFWAMDGPFRTSKNDVNKIILASHSALQQDFSSLYFWKKATSSELPWIHPNRLPTFSSTVNNTLYGHKYLTITIDEAHAFRNVGAKHSSALVLMELAAMRFVMTATPLQTSTKDVAGMGRLLGNTHFLSQAALDEEKSDLSTIRQAKRSDSEGPESLEEDDAVKECTVAIAQRMQRHFKDRILRRTTGSLDWKKRPLITLPPCHNIPIIVKPTPREMEIISELADRVKESVAASNGVLMIVSRSFYIEH